MVTKFPFVMSSTPSGSLQIFLKFTGTNLRERFSSEMFRNRIITRIIDPPSLRSIKQLGNKNTENKVLNLNHCCLTVSEHCEIIFQSLLLNVVYCLCLTLLTSPHFQEFCYYKCYKDGRMFYVINISTLVMF